MQEFSFRTRARALEALRHEDPLQILVIGGGITGVAAARDAARRDLSVGLIEARDFASGTSSRSSKLVHGGLRYLENFDFGLVYEGCQERRTLLDRDPLHVDPLEFVAPVYAGDKAGYYTLKAGMVLYDTLAAFRNIHMHQMLSKTRIQERVPGLRTQGLKGGASYYDARMDDARYCMATARAASREGAQLATYIRAEAIETKDKVHHVAVTDALTQESFEIRAEAVILACGPWTDRVRAKLLDKSKKVLAPTKGVHIVVPRHRMPLTRSLLMRHPTDGRVVFNIPWETGTIIGTTDTFFEGDPADAAADRADVDYILEVANFVFPEAQLTPEDVISTYTGLRPLMQEEGADEGSTSREHAVLEDRGSIFTIAGGKWTTHRRMAKDVVDRVLERLEWDALPCSTATAPVEELGTPMVDPKHSDNVQDLAEREGLEPAAIARLAKHFGRGMKEVLALAKSSPKLARPIVEGSPILAAEAHFWVTQEGAMTLVDGLDRRSSLSLVGQGQAYDECEAVAEIMGEAAGWDSERRQEEIAGYRAHVDQSRAWKKE